MLGESLCRDLSVTFGAISDCAATEGGVRYSTQCLYPSFEQVETFILSGPDGFIVHDGGGARRAAWRSGKDPKSFDAAIQDQANLFHLSVIDGALSTRVDGAQWLPAAIMAVANASATASRLANGNPAQAQLSEATLRDLIKDVLNEMVVKSTIKRANIGLDYEARGKSGKRHRFDFALRENSGGLTLIDAVSPHHISVASRYVAFSDITGMEPGLHGRLAVYQRVLDPEDMSLLGQFADVVPLTSLAPQLSKYVLS